MRTMRQREEELRDIHRKMHTVNEIYKDLGEVVDQQQEQIDLVDDQFGEAAEATRRGLEHIEKANSKTLGAGLKRDESDEVGSDKRKQFVLLHFLSKSVSEIAKIVSACTGSGSASYVD